MYNTHTDLEMIVKSKASAYFTLEEISNKHDVKAIKRELDTLPGVLSVSISDDSKRVAVDFDTTGVQRVIPQRHWYSNGGHV